MSWPTCDPTPLMTLLTAPCGLLAVDPVLPPVGRFTSGTLGVPVPLCVLPPPEPMPPPPTPPPPPPLPPTPLALPPLPAPVGPDSATTAGARVPVFVGAAGAVSGPFASAERPPVTPERLVPKPI